MSSSKLSFVSRPESIRDTAGICRTSTASPVNSASFITSGSSTSRSDAMHITAAPATAPSDTYLVSHMPSTSNTSTASAPDKNTNTLPTSRHRYAHGGLPLYAHQQPADEDRQDIAHKLHKQQLHKALRAVYAAEVRERGAARAETAQIHMKNIIRRYDNAAHAADAIGDNGNDYQQNGIYHSFSPFCRMTMRIGVPSRPNTARI